MLGFNREYGIGRNLATGVCYLAVADVVQAQFTGRYISDHLGTKMTNIPGLVNDTGIFLTGLLLRSNFLWNKPKKSDSTPVRELDNLNE